MRKKFSIASTLAALVISILVISCQRIQKNNENKIQRERRSDQRMTDLKGAMRFEFHMLKDPATGKIPDGIRDAELTQAREILARQQLTTRIEVVNPYSFQGPNNLGGRTRALAYDVRNGTSNGVIMAGGVSGGIYKSIDDGSTWVRKSPIGDLFSVSALAQDTRTTPVDHRDTWYYAGGEFSGNSASADGASYRGKGIYKSTDNGETWTHLPASNTGTLESFDHRADYVTRLVVDPTTGYVYMAAMDAIYRSTDGGTTWGFVLTSGETSWGTDMSTDIIVTPGGKLYASFSGDCNTGPTLNLPGVWTSTTGASGGWTKIAGPTAGSNPPGWNAAGAFGRVVLAYAPSLTSRVYALYWNGSSFSCSTPPGGSPLPEAEFFYWDDGPGTWTEITSTLPDEGPGTSCSTGNDPFACQTGYDLVVAVKPDDPATIFIGGTNLYRSTTTGASWTRIGGYVSPTSYGLYTSSHPDMHAISFSPTSVTTMLCGNDGGIQRTTDNLAGTVAWTQINTGYRTYQYYYVDIDPRVSNEKVIGGAQDNGTTRNVGGTGSTFESVFSGDGVSVGLNDPAITGGTQYEYVGFQNGYVYRRASTSGPGFGTEITPAGEGGSGLFVTLFKLDQDNTDKLYYANENTLFRTTSASTVLPGSWTTMTGVAASVTTSRDITALAMTRGTYSASTASLYIGASDDPFVGGTATPKLFRLDDPHSAAGTAVPVDITDALFPAGGFISSIAVNPRNDDTLLVTFSNYSVSSVWWTGNANSATPTWTMVEDNLTLPSYRSCAIHAVPNSPEVQYYVGTSVGLYRKTGVLPVVAGAANDWAQEGATTLGNAVISSLSFRPSDANLLVGTHGYGMWKSVLSLFPLPVELTEFKGTLQNNKTALLQWTTAAENNTRHFELERSFDGNNFRKIATIAAAGNSTIIRQYSYVDREPLTEKNYYRLRTVDINNESKLSNVILLQLAGAQQDMLVMGNPVRNNKLVIRFVKAPMEKGELRLNDMTGRLVARRVIGPGEQMIEFTIPSAVAGTYILQAIIGDKTYTTKVLKE